MVSCRLLTPILELTNSLKHWRRWQTLAGSLRPIAGRMSFAVELVLGRLAKACLNVFFSVVESSSGHLNDDMVQAIRNYVLSVKNDPPRTLNLSILPCAYIYTDASREPSAKGDIGGVEGVLGARRRTCGLLLSLSLCVAGMNLVLFVDNEASKAALITDSSDNRVANDLLRIQARTESNMALIPWVSRVPSRSYIADHLLRELQEFLPDWPHAGASS